VFIESGYKTFGMSRGTIPCGGEKSLKTTTLLAEEQPNKAMFYDFGAVIRK